MKAVTLLVIGSLLVPAVASAHRDDYIDETFVYMTLAKHEFELELWGEARDSRSDGTQGWYTGAFENGITDRWTLDAALQAVHEGGALHLGRFRAETRYRFANEGEWPLDLAVSAEYEMETKTATGGEEEHTLTPRLVVSKDVRPELNSTLNFDFPISLSGGGTSFAYALGVRYPAETTVRVGVEVKGEPSIPEATVFPQIWFALPKEKTIKLGTGFGLTDRTDKLVVRGVFEIEF
jgi:hypothetical protein